MYWLICCIHTNRFGHLWERNKNSAKSWPEHGMILWIHSAAGLSEERGSHEPGDSSRQEVLIAEADVARHGRVSLPEHLRHGLELGAHLDEAVQMDAGSFASHGEAAHQVLRKLGAQVVAHLSEGWRRDRQRTGTQDGSEFFFSGLHLSVNFKKNVQLSQSWPCLLIIFDWSLFQLNTQYVKKTVK